MAAAAAGIGGNRSADAIRESFLSHCGPWDEWQRRVQEVADFEIDVKAALKSDGFTVKQYQIRDALRAGPKSEAKVRGEVRNRLFVARCIGHKMGNQLDLFDQPDRTPAEETWFDDGKQASMENAAKAPPHAPGTIAYSKWMAGYDAHQATLMANGFKPLDDPPPADPVASAPGWGPSQQPAADPSRPIGT